MRMARQWSIAGLGPQDFRIREAEVAEPGFGEVMVRTEAVSLNFRDKLVMENGMGLPLTFPFVPASDMAGMVEAVGEGVTRFRPGDTVISTFMPGRLDGKGLGNARNPPYRTLGGAHPGVLSEYVTFPADWVRCCAEDARRRRGEHAALCRFDGLGGSYRERSPQGRRQGSGAGHGRRGAVCRADRPGAWGGDFCHLFERGKARAGAKPRCRSFAAA